MLPSFWKGSELPLFCRFPVAPSHSCFSAALLFRTSCGISQVLRTPLTYLYMHSACCPPEITFLFIYVTMILNFVWWHIWLVVNSTCILIYFTFLDNYVHLQHHLFFSYMCSVGFYYIIINVNEAIYVSFYFSKCQRLDKILMNPRGKMGHCSGWEERGEQTNMLAAGNRRIWKHGGWI